jgi:urease accessory protein
VNTSLKPQPNWHGTLDLKFSSHNGITQFAHSQAQAPLKVQRSFPQPDGTCQVVMLHTAGGMVGGDRLTTNIDVTPNSNALLTTAAAAKIYKANGLISAQNVTINVTENAYLEWLPQETIVFNEAHYQQNIRINLAENAEVILWDVTRFGRTARGERFVSGDWRSATEVWQGEIPFLAQPLWLDRQWLPASEELWQSPHGLAGMPIVGTFAWIGRSVEPELVQEVRSLWTGDPAHAGVTRLPKGLLCRYRGDNSTAVRLWFVKVWQLIRQTQWQRTIETPRVWML